VNTQSLEDSNASGGFMSDTTDQKNDANADGAEKGEAVDASTEIQKLQDQAEKYKNEFLYMRAEFENYKRNAIKERSELAKYGAERLIRDFLDVQDNFERALEMKVGPENFQAFLQGVQMTAKDLKSMLTKHGVQELKVEGQPFDPNSQEALSSESSTEVPAGNVLRVFKKAYKLHDKILRPAQVIVAKKPE
jgi:molecular chaperone GrpE